MPLGQACWLYLPVPTLLMVTGDLNTLSGIPVDLKEGWNLIGVVYSYGAHLLEMSPPPAGVGDGFGDTFWGWGLMQLGSGSISAGVNFGVSTLLYSMGASTDAKLNEHLNQISQDLARISGTLDSMNAKLDSTLNAIQVSKTEILKAIDHTTYVSPVQNALK